jgi:hypothetical protein
MIILDDGDYYFGALGNGQPSLYASEGLASAVIGDGPMPDEEPIEIIGPGSSVFLDSIEWVDGQPKTRLTPADAWMRVVSKGKPNRTVRIPFQIVTNNERYPNTPPTYELYWHEVNPNEWQHKESGARIASQPPFFYFVEAPYYYVDASLGSLLNGTVYRDDDDNDRVETRKSMSWVFWRNVLQGVTGLFGTLAHNGSGRLNARMDRVEDVWTWFFGGFLSGGWYRVATISRGGLTVTLDLDQNTIDWPPGFQMPLGINKMVPYPRSPVTGGDRPAEVYRPPIGFSLESQTDTQRVWRSNQDPSDTYTVTLSSPATTQQIEETVRVRMLGLQASDSMPVHIFDSGRMIFPPCDLLVLQSGDPDKLTVSSAETHGTIQCRLVYSGADGIQMQDITLPNGQAQAESMENGRLLWGYGVLAPHTPARDHLLPLSLDIRPLLVSA